MRGLRIDGRSVAFNLKDYDCIDHGYAATIHKAQGTTVDRTHVLATPGMDAHGCYVWPSQNPGTFCSRSTFSAEICP